MASLWLPALNAEGLSQGDVLAELPFGVLEFPAVEVEKFTPKYNEVAWREAKKPGNEPRWLAKGRRTPAIVLTHSCELDKPRKRARVLVAPLEPASKLPAEQRDIVFARQSRARMPLEAVPGLGGDYYADLRNMHTLDRQHLEAGRVVASMAPEGQARLHEFLILFLTRLEDDPNAQR